MRNFSDARLYGIENELFLYIFFSVHHRHKSEWVSLKFSPNVTPCLGITPCENDRCDKKLEFYSKFLRSTFPDTRYFPREKLRRKELIPPNVPFCGECRHVCL